MWLEREDFRTAVRLSPLVSIDLVVRDAAGRVLLGWRNNRPAQHCWFVPGGSIRKQETLDAAFRRISHDELGLDCERVEARWLGVYEHFYDDHFAGTDFGTHYVVLGHELAVGSGLTTLPDAQHARWRWFEVDELLASPEVHRHSKWYFDPRAC
ncbi:MAG TPA: GDP-mannose mannosyl hydrolase [Plasticicumulans sp.]|nr:GDP-mannose mannosyl hydrolase [Plasticicumulans sp.]